MTSTNLAGWPLWTMTYSHGRSTNSTTFFAATEDAACLYAVRWVSDLATSTGRKVAVKSVALA